MTQIDALRGAAALAVLVHHIYLQFWDPSIGSALFRWLGNWGVSLFFVISGFCIRLPMARSLASGSARFDLRDYALQRVLRIGPPYWAALAVTVGVGAFIHTGLLDGDHRPASLAVHALGVHTLAASTFGSVSGVFWTIGVEAQFYACYLLFARRPTSWSVWLGLLILGLAVFAAGSKLFPVGDAWRPVFQSSAPALFWQWYLGARLADVAVVPRAPRPVHLVWTIRLCALAVSIGLFAVDPVVAGLHVAKTVGLPLACAAVVWAWSLPAGENAALLAKVGLVSYSLYLLHPAAIALAVLTASGAVTASVLAAALALILAVLGYWLVEFPSMSARRGISAYLRPAPQPA